MDRVDPAARVENLSGGNQQKVLFGKCLFVDPAVLVLDEPTRGVDVGSRRVIYDRLAELVGSGPAVVVISSEIDEVLHLAHRILVVREGRQVASFEAATANHEGVLNAAFGIGPGSPPPSDIHVASDRSSE